MAKCIDWNKLGWMLSPMTWEHRYLSVYNPNIWLLVIYLRIHLVSISVGLFSSFPDGAQVGFICCQLNWFSQDGFSLIYYIIEENPFALLLITPCITSYFYWCFITLDLDKSYTKVHIWDYYTNCCTKWIIHFLVWLTVSNRLLVYTGGIIIGLYGAWLHGSACFSVHTGQHDYCCKQLLSCLWNS